MAATLLSGRTGGALAGSAWRFWHARFIHGPPLGSGAALLAQVLAMRELMEALRGNELSLGLALGVWLLLAGVSGWAGTIINKQSKNKGLAFSAGLLVISLLIPPAVMAPKFLLPMMGYAPGELVSAGGMSVLSPQALLALEGAKLEKALAGLRPRAPTTSRR